jgi:hypothetical protein
MPVVVTGRKGIFSTFGTGIICAIMKDGQKSVRSKTMAQCLELRHRITNNETPMIDFMIPTLFN